MKTPKPGKRVSLGLKVTSDVKRRIDAAAKASGRTQSQEAEALIERAFEKGPLLNQVLALAFGKEFGGLLLTLGACMQYAGRGASRRGNFQAYDNIAWLTDPYGFDCAIKAAHRLLEGFRPKGDPKPKNLEVDESNPVALAIEALGMPDGATYGAWCLNKLIHESPGGTTIIDQAREMLGPLVDNINDPTGTEGTSK